MPSTAKTQVSCESCRIRKIKCTYEIPCNQCSIKGIDCTYRERHRPGFRKGRFQEMSAKMTDLEAEIQLLRRLQPKSTLPSKSATQHLIQVFLNGPGRCMPDCVDVNGLRYNAPNLTLHAIVVLSLTLLETPYTALGLEESAEIYINRCTEYIYSKIMYETTLDSITALLILSFGVLLEGKGPSQWSVISLLTGTVNFVNLGAERKASNDTSRIHYLPTPVLPMASSEEMKRRQMIFWSSFCMESLICYATGVSERPASKQNN